MILRWFLALLLALTAGIGAIYVVTAGFSVLTAEGARRQAIARQPVELPSLQLVAEDGAQQDLRAMLAADGRVAIVNFFYTRCISLCLAQGALTERIQQAIEEQGLQDRIRLISISFDARDKAADLQRYAQRMHADHGLWRFYGFSSESELAQVLASFGIVVVPAPLGEFEHNAALHVVSPAGQLVGVFDLEQPGLAFNAARDLAQVFSNAAVGVHGNGNNE